MSSAPRFAAVLAVAGLAACGGPAIKHQVLTPPPSSPRAEFFLEKPEVQSREVGDEAWRRNEQLGAALAQALRDELNARGKTLAAPPAAAPGASAGDITSFLAAPADAIRSRIYLGHGKAPARAPGGRRPLAYIEVRLELLDSGSRHVRYSTHTRTKISSLPFGLGADVEEIIQNTLRQSAADFVSRL